MAQVLRCTEVEVRNLGTRHYIKQIFPSYMLTLYLVHKIIKKFNKKRLIKNDKKVKISILHRVEDILYFY